MKVYGSILTRNSSIPEQHKDTTPQRDDTTKKGYITLQYMQDI